MKKVKFLGLLGFLSFLTLVISTPSAIAQSFKVGAILPKTGYGASLGKSAQNGINLALEEEGNIGGRKMEMVVYDSEGKEASAVLAAKRLIEKDKVLAIVGPVMTGAGAAVIPIVEKAEIPMLFLGGGTMVTEPPELRRFCFRIAHSHRQAPMKALEHLKRAGAKKFGVLYVNNAFGRDGMEELSKWASLYDLTAVSKESVEQGDVDVTPQLTKLRDSGADWIVLWVVGTPAVITYKNYKQMGIKIPLLGNHGLADSIFRERVGDDMIGTHILAIRTFAPEGLPDSDPAKKFLVAFKKKYVKTYGYVPGTFDGDAYDGVRLVAKALKGNATTPRAIRDYLEKNIHNWEGTNGTFTFHPGDHGGLYSGQMIIATAVKGGEGWEMYKYK
jgi:branched-chain amino acid transport system substrate-binding protein